MDLKASWEPVEWRDLTPEDEPEVAEADRRGARVWWGAPPLVNVYQPGGPAYLWLRLIYDVRDLDLQEHFEYAVGWRPRWLEDAVSDSGISGIIRCDWKGSDDGPWGGSWVYWGITHGIGPGQPFCVELYPPYWSCTPASPNGPEEWDCEWNWDLVRVMPRKPLVAARSWDRYFKDTIRWEERRERAKGRLRKKREQDVSALYLKWFTYFGRHDHAYDEMSRPSGVGVRLCSKHTSENGVWLFHEEMMEGRDDDGNREKALDELLKRFFQTEVGRPRTKWDLAREGFKPYISERTIRNLPARSDP
jgi:hypothetical protein